MATVIALLLVGPVRSVLPPSVVAAPLVIDGSAAELGCGVLATARHGELTTATGPQLQQGSPLAHNPWSYAAFAAALTAFYMWLKVVNYEQVYGVDVKESIRKI